MRWLILGMIVVAGGVVVLAGIAWGLIIADERRSRRYYQEHPEAGERLIAAIKLAFTIPNWNSLSHARQKELIESELQKGPVQGCPTEWTTGASCQKCEQ